MPQPDEVEEARAKVRELHELDPEHNPPPDETMEYEFFMPETVEDGHLFKRKMDVFDLEDDEEIPNSFRLKRIRAYESAHLYGRPEEKYDDEVVIALHDGTDGLHSKAAYYYPILQRASIRPQRTKNIQRHKNHMDGDSGDVADYVNVEITDLTETMKEQRTVHVHFPYGKDADVDAEGEEDAVGEDD